MVVVPLSGAVKTPVRARKTPGPFERKATLRVGFDAVVVTLSVTVTVQLVPTRPAKLVGAHTSRRGNPNGLGAGAEVTISRARYGVSPRA